VQVPPLNVVTLPLVKLAVVPVNVVPEIVPVTVKLPEVDANNPETVMLLSTPALVKVMVSTRISPYGIVLTDPFYDSSFLKLILKE